MRAALGEVEAVSAQEVGVGMILGVRRRDAQTTRLAALGPGRHEFVDDPTKLVARVAGDRGPVLIEFRTCDPDLTGADHDSRGREAHDARRRLPRLAVADPEEEVDVGLVRRLVVPEACPD